MTEPTGTRSDGHKQDRNSADGCGEDRAYVKAQRVRKGASQGGGDCEWGKVQSSVLGA